MESHQIYTNTHPWNQFPNVENVKNLIPVLYWQPPDISKLYLLGGGIATDPHSHWIWKKGFLTAPLAPRSAQLWLGGSTSITGSPAPPPVLSASALKRSPLQCLVLLTLWNLTGSQPKIVQLQACFALLKWCRGHKVFSLSGGFSNVIWTQL